jgi:DNA-binding CsgD family transcriptional regulator
MSDTPDSNIVEFHDRDQQMFELRLQGASIRSIARQFRISEQQVQATVARMCTPLTVQLRAHTFELELERLDQLQKAFFTDAQKGDPAAAAITLKILERRACMMGIDAPRADPMQLIAEANPVKKTTTDRIEAALKRLRYDPGYGGSPDADDEPPEPAVS